MPKYKITTKGNPITTLPERNKVIFTRLIPTVRKVQEKKYFEILYKEKQNRDHLNYYVKDVTERVNDFFNTRIQMIVSKKKRDPIRIENLTHKNQKEIRRFIVERLKNLDLIDSDYQSLKSSLEKITKEVIEHIRKYQKTEKQLSKKSATKQILEDIDYYEYLHPIQKEQILSEIKETIATITKDKYITETQNEKLRDYIFGFIEKKIDPSSAIQKKTNAELYSEIMSSHVIKTELQFSTPAEKQKILSVINSLILDFHNTNQNTAYNIIREYIRLKYSKK